MSWGCWIVFKGAIQHLYAFCNVQESLWGDLTDPVFSSDEYLHIKILTGSWLCKGQRGKLLNAPGSMLLLYSAIVITLYLCIETGKEHRRCNFLSINKIRRDFVTSCASYLLYYEYDMRALT